MASRRYLKSLHRHYSSFFSSNTPPHNLKIPLRSLCSTHLFLQQRQLEYPTSNLRQIFLNPQPLLCNQFKYVRHFSSRHRGPHKGEEDGEDDYEDDDAVEDSQDEDEEDELSECSEEDEEAVDIVGSNCVISRTYSVEETEKEAEAIGYKVLGPLDPTERPFKHREPYFAVVQIGSHQFKVSNGDYIYTEKLKFCQVNDKLNLNKVLMVGSESQTIIGRPILPAATVHAVVEEHALDAKVIIFKKKRRKNYRRTKGHRQELTRLRIVDIQGIEKADKVPKPEKVAVAA